MTEYDPRNNVLAGAAYLRELHDRYGAPGFLAAYNSGPRRYDRHLSTGRSLPAETREYIAKLAPMIEGNGAGGQRMVARGAPTWRQASLFVVRADTIRLAISGYLSCTPIAHRASAPWSISRRSHLNRSACLHNGRDRPAHNDPVRTSSQFVGERRMP